jgi:hypothetical protein
MELLHPPFTSSRQPLERVSCITLIWIEPTLNRAVTDPHSLERKTGGKPVPAALLQTGSLFNPICSNAIAVQIYGRGR